MSNSVSNIKPSMGNVGISNFTPSYAASSSSIEKINTNINPANTYLIGDSKLEEMNLDIDNIRTSTDVSNDAKGLEVDFNAIIESWRKEYNTDSYLIAISKGLADTGVSVLSSAVTSTFAIGEGILNFTECIGDAAAIVLGGCASISLLKYDVLDGLFTGDWSFSRAKNNFDKTMAFVANDWSSAVFDWVYETKFGSAVNSNAFKIFQRGEFAYETIESVTEVTCAILLGGVIGSGVSTSSIAASIIYGVSATGENFEGTAQKFTTNSGNVEGTLASMYAGDTSEISEGPSSNSNILDEFVTNVPSEHVERVILNLFADACLGVLEGVVFYLTYGDTGWNNFFKGKEILGKEIEKNTLNKSILQGVKSITKDGINYFSGDLKIEEDETLIGKIAWNAFVNIAAQVGYDKFVKSNIVDPSSKKISEAVKKTKEYTTKSFSGSSGNNKIDKLFQNGFNSSSEHVFSLNVDTKSFSGKTKSTIGKSPIKELANTSRDYFKEIIKFFKENKKSKE